MVEKLTAFVPSRRSVWRRSPLTVVGLVLIAVLALIALSAPLIAPSENVTRYTPTGTPASSWASRCTVARPRKVAGSTGPIGASLDRKMRISDYTRRSAESHS